MSRTPFAETEVFLAVMEGDEGRARELLALMLLGELADLQRVAERVDELAEDQLAAASAALSKESTDAH